MNKQEKMQVFENLSANYKQEAEELNARLEAAMDQLDKDTAAATAAYQTRYTSRSDEFNQSGEFNNEEAAKIYHQDLAALGASMMAEYARIALERKAVMAKHRQDLLDGDLKFYALLFDILLR